MSVDGKDFYIQEPSPITSIGYSTNYISPEEDAKWQPVSSLDILRGLIDHAGLETSAT